MAQSGNVERVTTDPTTQLRAAILQDAAAYLDLQLPESIAAGRTCRSILRGISIVSVENTGWELWLFTKQTQGAEPNVAVSNFLGFWTFAAGTALRIGGAGLYYYYVDGLAVPYEVLDLLANGRPDEQGQRRNLHMALVARESAKSAGDAGGVKVQFVLEATLGF